MIHFTCYRKFLEAIWDRCMYMSKQMARDVLTEIRVGSDYFEF